MCESALLVSHILLLSVVIRHHDHGNSQKKDFIGGIQLQRVRPLPSWWRTWQLAGKHGTEVVLESLYLDPQAWGREKANWE